MLIAIFVAGKSMWHKSARVEEISKPCHIFKIFNTYYLTRRVLM